MAYQNGQNKQIQVIEILEDDEQEEMRKNQQKIEYERNRQALYKAHMGTQFDVLVAIVKLDIKGTQQQKDKIFKKRLLKFFSNDVRTINLENQHFRQRRQAKYNLPDVQPVPNQIILYGVDFLSTKQVKQKFSGLDITLSWLDDSHCKIIFENAQDAKRGIQMNLKTKSLDSVKLENDDEQIPRNWFELLPYSYFTFQRKLYCRYAASNQNQAEINRSNQAYLYEQSRRKFQQSIRDEVDQKKYLDVMRKYKYIDDRKYNERRRKFQRNRNERGGSHIKDHRRRDKNISEQLNNDLDQYHKKGNRRNSGRYERQDRSDRNNYGYDNWNNDNGEDLSITIKQRQRSRNKPNKKDFDSLSMISRGSNISHRSRQQMQKRMSQSIQYQDNFDDDQEEAKSNYSFILNQKQLDSSQQMISGLNNLNIGDISHISQRNFKEQEQDRRDDLSICSQGGMKKQKQKKSQILNTSFNEDLSRSITMKRKKDINTSIILEDKPKIPVKNIDIINLADERD